MVALANTAPVAPAVTSAATVATAAKTAKTGNCPVAHAEAIVSLSVLDLSAPLIVYGTVIRSGG
jgi:hypothetical protein